MDYALLDDCELCTLLKREDGGAWRYVLEVLTAQEKRSLANNRKRADWGISLESLIGQLYEEMVGQHKLDLYRGRGSLIGWMRMFLRGYLNRQNPTGRREQLVLDAPMGETNEGEALPLVEKISSSLSVYPGGSAYGDEDLQRSREEKWDVAQRCFRDLWLGNGVQAYVLLLKTRFHLSSVEIASRLGISSSANVDQIFSRAVKRMKELKVKHER